MNNPIVKYPPGSQWLYLRIYGGPQALESWLTTDFIPLLTSWKNSGFVSRFHFLHYLDPEYHLRIRLFLPDPKHAGILLQEIQESCGGLLREDLMWKIEVGTYEPEYERYGVERIRFVEEWFEIDSWFWLEEIQRKAGLENPEIWKIAVQSVHALLMDFGFDMDVRIQILHRLVESSAAMFGMTSSMRGQLGDKYRRMEAEITPLLQFYESAPELHLKGRSENSAGVISRICDSFENASVLAESTLLSGIIHMSLNRAFRSRHRLQELVVYDFLFRYYRSARARSKIVEMES